MKKAKDKVEPFTMIKEWYWQCGLDITEVNIIARISSWQREKKVFFESKASLAKLFMCDRKVIIRRFERLESIGVIVKGPMKGRAYSYSVNENRLNELYLRGTASTTNCTSEVRDDAKCVPQKNDNCTSEVRYHNNKTINKNSFKKEDDCSSSSSFKAPKTISEADLIMLAREE